MKTEPQILILTGESSSGKTTVCRRIVTLCRAQGLDVSGILTPPRLVSGCRVGLDVEDIRTGQSRPLAERSGDTDGPTTENWRFHTKSLAWGTMVLCHATPCNLLIIDELGPLELTRDQGWTVGISLLRANRYRLALIVVRPALLPRLRERLAGIDLQTLVVTRISRDNLPGDILALFKPEEVRERILISGCSGFELN